MSRRDRRFQRQFDALGRLAPALRAPVAALRRGRWRILRVPLALLLIVGGIFSVLPFLGLWMLPLGLLLLAVDLPLLRTPVAALLIRARRQISLWTRRWRSRGS